MIVNRNAEQVDADTLVGWSVRNTANFGNPGDATGVEKGADDTSFETVMG